VFTILAGLERTPFVVHASVLQQSPVFRAMTEHPFKEKEAQTIELPEAIPAYVDCLVRFLYAGHYVSPKELEYRKLHQEAARAWEDSAKSSFDGFGGAYVDAWGNTVSEEEDDADDSDDPDDSDDSDDEVEGAEEPSSFAVSAEDDVETDDTDETDTDDLDGFSPRELEIGEDLAHIYILGDLYQLPGLKSLTLKKLKDTINTYANPIGFFILLTLLQSSVPESDKELYQWVQEEWPVASSQMEHKGDEGHRVLEEYLSRFGPPKSHISHSAETKYEEVRPSEWNDAKCGYAWLYHRCATCSKPLDEDRIW